VVLDGTMTGLTHERADIDVAGHWLRRFRPTPLIGEF
jgi:hypothetical protein